MLNVLVLPGARATSWRALWPRMGVLEAWAVHQVGPLGAANQVLPLVVASRAGLQGAASPAVVVTRMDSSWAYLMCGWVRLLLQALPWRSSSGTNPTDLRSMVGWATGDP